MLSAYMNSMKIPELRRRIFFTLGIIVLVRLVQTIPVPGVDSKQLESIASDLNSNAGGIGGMLNLFSGGALGKFAVAALGIMPYISASIIVQLLTPVLPQLEKLSREGDVGRQKISQYTRYLTLLICAVQGFMLATTMQNPKALVAIGLPEISPVIQPGMAFTVTTTIFITAGTIFLMWLGEQITERGIGNGGSIIITVGIIDRLPSAIGQMYKLVTSGGSSGSQSFTLIHAIILLAMFFFCCAATVALTQGMRKIPVKYARATMGGRHATSGQTSYMPLRVNYSGVMPLIFGSSILMFPPVLIKGMGMVNMIDANRAAEWSGIFTRVGFTYNMMYAVLIILFAFFWVANQFNPIQIADDLQKNGGYVPGVRPGQPTAEFLDKSMTRITFAGALFLTALAIIPPVISDWFGVPMTVSGFFGGTSLLIMVGVMLDTMRQVESYLLSYHYDGFLSKGHLRSRRG